MLISPRGETADAIYHGMAIIIIIVGCTLQRSYPSANSGDRAIKWDRALFSSRGG